MVVLELNAWNVIGTLGIILGVLSLYTSINVISRCENKLKDVFIFLTITIILLTARSIMNTFKLIPDTYKQTVDISMELSIAILVLLSTYSMRKTIDSLDNKKPRRK